MALQQQSSLIFEFAMFLEHLISLSGQISIVGDVNLHLDNTSNNQTRISGTTGYHESELTGESTNS